MANAILGLLAETSIHAGTGQTVGAVDLPIQREKHTDYPCIYGSGMKGALRANAETRNGSDKAWVVEVFGPDTDNASDHAGAISVSDARLLLLPVRSLTGHYKLVTCPAMLGRLKRDMTMLGVKFAEFAIPTPGPQEVISSGDSTGKLFLEELVFTLKNDDEIIKGIAGEIAKLAPGIVGNLEKQLIVMADEDFAWYARHSTAVTPHIAIDNDNKTVKGGALWYEESLPPDTLMYCMLMAEDSRKKQDKDGKPFPYMKADAVLGCVTGMFALKPYIQVGGNETVGMGWFNVAVREGGK